MDIKLEKGAVQICRICLQDVEPDYPLLYLNFAISLNSTVTIQDKLMECVPEINLNAVPNAVICNECSIVLSSAYNFKLKCLRTEMQIKKYLQQINATTLFDLAEVQRMDVVNRNIKDEEVVIPDLKTELEDGSFNGSAVVDEDFNISTQEVLKNQCYTHSEYTDAYFSCYMCDYTTDSNSDFSLHIETHAENFSDMVKMESQENAAVEASSSLLPVKSKERYEKCYSLFCEWRTSKTAKGIDENVMMTYFLEKAKHLKASSLWSMYSMIKSTLQVNENVDISSYKKLLDFLKRQNDRYVPKKSNMLTMENIMTFLNSAPDDTYLLMKVVLIFGLNGACRRAELCAVKAKDIEDTGSILVVTLQDRITNKKRIFTITSDCNGIEYYRKYACLRPKNVSHGRFFIFYKNGKCSPQPVGINSFGNMPKKIAEYLKLPNSSSYTGHCLRRTSATFLSDSGTDVRMLKRYRRHY